MFCDLPVFDCRQRKDRVAPTAACVRLFLTSECSVEPDSAEGWPAAALTQSAKMHIM